MPNITLNLTTEQVGELYVKSLFEGLSADAYIKKVVFGTDPGVFTPKEALKRAIAEYAIGDEFDLRELYTNDEWAKLDRGERIAFGRNFFTYTKNIQKGVVRLVDGSGKQGRRAKYILLRDSLA